MIYFLRLRESDYYKIGFAKMFLKERINELQTAAPRKLELRFVINGDKSLESEIHSELNSFRTDGGVEWFELTEAQVETYRAHFSELIIDMCEALKKRRYSDQPDGTVDYHNLSGLTVSRALRDVAVPISYQGQESLVMLRFPKNENDIRLIRMKLDGMLRK